MDKKELFIQQNLSIPLHEIVITTGRSGGPGGQHVNVTNTKVTIHWNVQTTKALSDAQRMRVLEKLKTHISDDGNLVIHSSESRSQLHNKRAALDRLVNLVRCALHVPKKRTATKVPASVVRARRETKERRSLTKKLRSKIVLD